MSDGRDDEGWEVDGVPAEVREEWENPSTPAGWWEKFADEHPDSDALAEAKGLLISAGVPEGQLYELLWHLHAWTRPPQYPEHQQRLRVASKALTKSVAALRSLDWIYRAVLEERGVTPAHLEDVAEMLSGFALGSQNVAEKRKAEQQLARLVDKKIQPRGRVTKKEAHKALAVLMTAASGEAVTVDKVRVTASRQKQKLGTAKAPARRKARSVRGTPAARAKTGRGPDK